MDDKLIEYVVAWIPIVLMLGVFGYFVMKLVHAQRRSVAALEDIARKLEQIDQQLPVRLRQCHPPTQGGVLTDTTSNAT